MSRALLTREVVLRPLSDHGVFIGSRRLPTANVVANAHRTAAKRAARRFDRDERVGQVVDEILAAGGHDELLLGDVDPAPWNTRERFVARVVEHLLSGLAETDSASVAQLVEDHVRLEVDARFPALSDVFQPVVERLEREWGYVRTLDAEMTLPGLRPGASAVAMFTRQPHWAATRVADGAPTQLSAQEDSGLLRLPHAISVHRVNDEFLTELWMWPADATGWTHAWLILQDDTRLVPFRTVQVDPDHLDPAFRVDLDDLVAAVAAWWGILDRRHAAIAGRYGYPDGMPGLPRR